MARRRYAKGRPGRGVVPQRARLTAEEVREREAADARARARRMCLFEGCEVREVTGLGRACRRCGRPEAECPRIRPADDDSLNIFDFLGKGR